MSTKYTKCQLIRASFYRPTSLGFKCGCVSQCVCVVCKGVWLNELSHLTALLEVPKRLYKLNIQFDSPSSLYMRACLSVCAHVCLCACSTKQKNIGFCECVVQISMRCTQIVNNFQCRCRIDLTKLVEQLKKTAKKVTAKCYRLLETLQ